MSENKAENILQTREEPADSSLLWATIWLTRHHARPASQAALSAGLPCGKTLTPQVATRMLEQAGIEAAWTKRPVGELSTHLFPVIVTDKQGRYDIVRERCENGYRLCQENGSDEILSAETVGENYLDFVLLSKAKIERKVRHEGEILPESQREGHWLFANLWRYRHYFFSAALAALLANVLTLSTTFFTMNVYDRVVPTQAYATLWSLAIGVLIAITFEFCSRQIRTYLIDVAGKKADLLVGSRLFKQTLALRLESKPRSSGSFANQLREFESVRDFISSATLATLSDLPFCLLFMAIMYCIGGPLAVVPLLAMPVIILFSIAIQWPLARFMKENVAEISQKQGLVIESITGMETLKACKGEGVMQKRWDDCSALAAASSMKTRYLSSLTTNMVSYVQQICTILIVVWGVYLIHAGELTMGALVGMVILSGRALSPLAAVVGLAVRYQQAKTALTSLNQLMKQPTERNPQQRYLASPELKGDIALRHATFSYPKTDQHNASVVLSPMSIRIQPGERVAILGNVGSGKSTLLKLLARLYQPTGGQLLMDGLDAQQIDPADWRSCVGYVSQESHLFQGTLRQNVMLGDPSASSARFLEIVRLAGLDTIANRHPLGFDMPIGEMGQGLSGGQKQLVALARCLLLQPDVCLMDEPTSAMDGQTEAKFVEHLKQATLGKTLVMVTHRHSVLSIVDRLIVLDEGKIIADGPKQQVLAALNSPRRARPSHPATQHRVVSHETA